MRFGPALTSRTSSSISARHETLCNGVIGPFQNRPAPAVAHAPIRVVKILRIDERKTEIEGHLTCSIGAVDIPVVDTPAADIAVVADIAAGVVS